MLNRLRWIAVSYLSRQIALGVALGMFFSSGLLFWSEKNPAGYASNYPQVVVNTSDMERKEAEVRPEPRLVTSTPQPRQTVTVTFMNANDMARAEDWRTTMQTNTFETSKYFPNVRHLDITAPLPQAFRPEKLTVLPKLEMLVWHGWFFDDAMIRGFAKLPNLQTLVIDDQSEVPELPKISEQALASLGHAPRLKTLYIGSLHAPADRTVEKLARRVLPNIEVVPSYDFEGFHFECVPFIALAIFIGLQLSRQFSNPLCRVAPGYVVSHAIVGLGLTLLVAALCAANLLRFISDPLLAITFSAAMVSAAVGFLSTSSMGMSFRRATADPKVRNAWRIASLFGFIALPLWIVLLEPDICHWVLLEHHAWMPWTLGALAIISAAYVVWSLSHLIGWSSGGSVPTTGERKLWQNNLWPRSNFRRTCLFPSSSRERKIERWQRKSPEWTWWARVARWRVGNPPNGQAIVFFPLIIFPIAIGVIANAAALSNVVVIVDRLRSMRFSTVMLILPMALVFALRVAMIWRSRLPILQRELLLPVSAQGLKREWIAAFLCDLIPAAFIAGVLIAITTPFDRTGKIDWPWIPWNFLLSFIVTLTLTAAFASAAVVQRRGWLAAVLVPVAVFVLMLIAWAPPLRNTEWVPLAVIMAVATVICGLTAFRWLRMEAA